MQKSTISILQRNVKAMDDFHIRLVGSIIVEMKCAAMASCNASPSKYLRKVSSIQLNIYKSRQWFFLFVLFLQFRKLVEQVNLERSFNANLYFQFTWLFWILMTLEFLYFVLCVCFFFSNKNEQECTKWTWKVSLLNKLKCH